MFKQKRPHRNIEPETSNKFGASANDDIEADEGNKIDVQTKPPPVFIPHVRDINKMVSEITKLISTIEFHYKSLRDGQVRVGW